MDINTINNIDTFVYDNDNLLITNDDMLTTLDNEYNPKQDFDKWLAMDEELGYNTSEYISRLADFDYDDDDMTTSIKYQNAVLEILHNNPDTYRLV